MALLNHHARTRRKASDDTGRCPRARLYADPAMQPRRLGGRFAGAGANKTIVIKETKSKGHTAKASKEEPQLLGEIAKSGREAA